MDNTAKVQDTYTYHTVVPIITQNRLRIPHEIAMQMQLCRGDAIDLMFARDGYGLVIQKAAEGDMGKRTKINLDGMIRLQKPFRKFLDVQPGDKVDVLFQVGSEEIKIKKHVSRKV